MINSNKNLLSNEGVYRLSVLDTLLNRSVSDIYQNELSSEAVAYYSDSDKHSHHVSPPSSQNLSENGVTNSTIGSPVFPETKTPTTRAQQLPILLARNYYTAPACLLRFINTASTIKSNLSQKRDSDGTVIDNQFDPIVDCNVDTNDEMDNFKSDDDVDEIFSIGSMTNRTSLMSDPQFHDSQDLGYLGVDPVDLNMVIQSVKSKYSSHFDKGCSPFFNMNESNLNIALRETIDAGTSPLIFDKSEKVDNCTSPTIFNSDTEMKPETTTLEPCTPEEMNNLGTTDVENDFDGSAFPLENLDNDVSEPPEFPRLKSGDFSVDKSDLMPCKQIPVYCRSLLYRIRVPLSKRLKNVDEDMLEKSMTSPLLSVSRANLSCDRLYSSKTRLSNSVDSSSSFLRLSDLDSYSLESSRSDMKMLMHPSVSFNGNKKNKRNFSSYLYSEDRPKVTKKYRRFNRL